MSGGYDGHHGMVMVSLQMIQMNEIWGSPHAISQSIKTRLIRSTCITEPVQQSTKTTINLLVDF